MRQGEVACAAGDREGASAAVQEAVRLAAAFGAAPLLDEAHALARPAPCVALIGLDGTLALTGALVLAYGLLAFVRPQPAPLLESASA